MTNTSRAILKRKPYLRKHPIRLDQSIFVNAPTNLAEPIYCILYTFSDILFSGPTAAWSYKQIDPNTGQSSNLWIFGQFKFDHICPGRVVLRSLEIPDWTLLIVRHVFILGPSHRVYFTQCATPVVDCYETPLGNLKLDDEIIQKLQVDLLYKRWTTI